ncbi:MAG: DinB family protein [Gemmatimonadetes bacterium]|nr:DinB family protein [Gemmatimonadota bacterium]
MELERIREMFEYNRWANERMLEAAATLTPEQLTRDLRNSFPSVRDTLAHIVGAEWVWLMRWQGTSPQKLPDPDGFATVASLRVRHDEIVRDRQELLDALTEAELERVISYRNFKGEPFAYPLWQLLRHVINHSSYHRGQITTLLRQLGAQPVGTDLLRFYDARAPR